MITYYFPRYIDSLLFSYDIGFVLTWNTNFGQQTIVTPQQNWLLSLFSPLINKILGTLLVVTKKEKAVGPDTVRMT